jgi:hypothetical protein
LHPSSNGPSRFAFAIEGDIKGCFDAIDHHVLLERLRLRIGDRKVLRLIRRFLQAGILAEGRVRNPVTGTPQGGIISPLLANVYLTALDERYRRWTPDREHYSDAKARDHRRRHRAKGMPAFYMVRYADDFVILVAGMNEGSRGSRALTYRSRKNEHLLRQRMLVSHVHRKKPAHRPMPARIARANARKSAVRAHIEHIFAEPKHRMGLFVRTIDLARATTKIGLANLVTNMRRLVWLEHQPALA